MAKYKGVTQQADGSWVYRLKIKLPSGKVVDTRIKKAPDGSSFLTARAAADAKAQHELRLLNAERNGNQTAPIEKTLAEVYKNYMENDGTHRAPATIRKQESMWKNYVQPLFGDREVNSITIVELNTFLNDLYLTKNKSYAYVEGFLKFFYLLFGEASRMEVIDQDKYVRMFEMGGTRLTMPARKQTDPDENDVRIFSDYELKTIEEVFKSEDGNLLTAFYLGLYCGLRISEVFGIRWSDIDWVNKKIHIERQMHYDDGKIVLCGVKTLTSKRDVLITENFMEYLNGEYAAQAAYAHTYGMAYRNTERVFDEQAGKWIEGGDFVNRKKNGELLTVNSIKYWSKKINTEYNIPFKFHYLRHTFASKCATQNVNLQMLMTMMGHKKLETTRKYYISTNQADLHEATRRILDNMYNFRSAKPPKIIEPVELVVTDDKMANALIDNLRISRNIEEVVSARNAYAEYRKNKQEQSKKTETSPKPKKANSKKAKT